MLSAWHQLNRAGYVVVFALGWIGLWLWSRQTGRPLFSLAGWPKLRRRFRRSFPLAFLLLATLAFLGGVLHGANNYDAMAYRTPRVLHWLVAEQWQWIHTDFQRLNTRTAGFEWLTAPQFLFLHTDHLVFLLNVVAFLFLPGRVFAILTRLGVRRRAAWHWMWLFPTGYGYVLQAGSVANDMFGALLAMAALEFALRASREKTLPLIWTAGVAAGLMTAVKAFNLLLLLPWGIAILPALPRLLRRPIASLAVMLFAVSASMVPTCILNVKSSGEWTGAKAEGVPVSGGNYLLCPPLLGVNLLINNFAPPICPFNKAWEAFVQRNLPAGFKEQVEGKFEKGLTKFQIPELQAEETAGLGCGLSLLLLALLIRKLRARELRPAKIFTLTTLVPLGGWACFGVFLLRVGLSGPARFLLPFYLLLLVPLMAGPAAGGIFQLRRWRWAAYGIFLVAGLLVVLSPQRVLWPATTVLRSLDAEHSPVRLLNRAWNVYSVYGGRENSFGPLVAQLPPDANPLGFVTFDEPEAALWRPFGSRQILHVRADDLPADLHARHLKYVLVSESFLAQHTHLDAAAWLAREQAEKVQEFKLHIHAGQEPESWFLAKVP